MKRLELSQKDRSKCLPLLTERFALQVNSLHHTWNKTKYQSLKYSTLSGGIRRLQFCPPFFTELDESSLGNNVSTHSEV